MQLAAQASRSKSSASTRRRSTAAWTSAPPSPRAAERRAVPHHLIDLIDPTERYSAGRFREDAIRAVAEIHGTRENSRCSSAARCSTTARCRRASTPCRRPIPDLRAQIDARRRAPRLAGAARRARAGGSGDRRAPRAQRRAAHPARARSLANSTGKPISELQRSAETRAAVHAAGLRARPRRTAQRCTSASPQRFDAMLKAGLVEELSALRRKFRADRRTCRACAASATARPGASSKAKSPRSRTARNRHRRHAPARQAPAHLAAQPARPRAGRAARRRSAEPDALSRG